MRTPSFLVIIIMLSMILFGCSSGGEQDKIVINYCKSIEAGKLDEAVSYLSKDAKQALEQAGGKSELAGASDAFKKRKGIKKIQINKREVAGDTAKIMFLYVFNDGSTIGDFFPLVKEDGKWKISK